MVDIKSRIEKDLNDPDLMKYEGRYKSFTLGPYFKFFKHLKFGVFYRGQLGSLHDDDWWWPLDGAWEWRDTKQRYEHIGILDVTPRFRLPFIPGKTWTIELKTRYEFNFNNLHQSLKVRPGLGYSLVIGGKPIVSFTLQYEMYIALNYGVFPLIPKGASAGNVFHGQKEDELKFRFYETWLYLGTLFHISPVFKIGLFGSLKKNIWNRSEEWIVTEKWNHYPYQSDTYENKGYPHGGVEYKSFYLGLTFVFIVPVI